jgi:hypothetical protein
MPREAPIAADHRRSGCQLRAEPQPLAVEADPRLTVETTELQRYRLESNASEPRHSAR